MDPSPMAISRLLLSTEDEPPTPRLSFSSESTISDIVVDQPCKRQKRNNHAFIHRVSSSIPLVHSAIKVYENSKNSSTVVKYGAEKVESFVGPIYDKLGVDEWGCKQLDKLEERLYLRNSNDDDETTRPNKRKSSSSSSSSSTKWHQILVISKERIKCLKYCIHWLEYACNHIKQQIALLQSSQVINSIKKEIVNTLRKVVNIVSKFSGNTLLSTQAKETVRGYILSLPSKWDMLDTENLAERLFSFAKEAVQMIQSVVNVLLEAIPQTKVVVF